MGLSRKKKLDKVLKDNVGRWMSASKILNEIGKRWNLECFGSSRSLAIFLKRYRFKTKEVPNSGKHYYIEEEKVDNTEENPYQDNK